VVLTRKTSISGIPLALVASLLPFSGSKAQQAQPCATPEAAHFDFWLGEWEVRLPNGNLVGENSIEKILNGCVIRESYRTPTGYAGQSLNIFDASRKLWHQTWVDVGGLLLTLEGGFEEGAMILRGQTVGAEGPVLQRIRWSVVDGDSDRVRQLWETSQDGGNTWTTAFDGLYVRKGGG